MRWLLIGLLISVGALLFVAAAVAWHVLRQRRGQVSEAAGKSADRAPELDLLDETDLKALPAEDSEKVRDPGMGGN